MSEALVLTGIIRNARWCQDDYRSPNLYGAVYGNPRFGDGVLVWTSTVVEDLGNDTFRTRSGSVYRVEWADPCTIGRPAALPHPHADGPDRDALEFIYLNHRDEVATRRAYPISVRYGTSQWHKEPQWLMRAWDLDKGAEREFAMKDMGV